MLKAQTSGHTCTDCLSISKQVRAVSAPLRNRCIADELFNEIAPNSTDGGGPSYSDTIHNNSMGADPPNRNTFAHYDRLWTIFMDFPGFLQT